MIFFYKPFQQPRENTHLCCAPSMWGKSLDELSTEPFVRIALHVGDAHWVIKIVVNLNYSFTFGPCSHVRAVLRIAAAYLNCGGKRVFDHVCLPKHPPPFTAKFGKRGETHGIATRSIRSQYPAVPALLLAGSADIPNLLKKSDGLLCSHLRNLIPNLPLSNNAFTGNTICLIAIRYLQRLRRIEGVRAHDTSIKKAFESSRMLLRILPKAVGKLSSFVDRQADRRDEFRKRCHLLGQNNVAWNMRVVGLHHRKLHSLPPVLLR